jgi:hypothetical protein
MLKSRFIACAVLCILGILNTRAQLKSSILIRSTREDERIYISINKPVYFPGDTVRFVIQRHDSASAGTITPILDIEGTTLKSVGRHTYAAIIPQSVTPGLYHVFLWVTDPEGRRYRYESDCVVTVEEYQDVEQLSRYVSIFPVAGGNSVQTAVTLDREELRQLEVGFLRDSIGLRMGPQFLRVSTTIQLREGIAVPSYARRIVTFRSHGDPDKDRAMFIQYRTAYGAYANIRPEELEHVLVPVDSLPDWAILGVHIEPDYTIKIGAVDRSNVITQYYRVRGSTIELGFSLAVPKVLYDTRSVDTVQYGNYSAMVRMYFISPISGNRFPISAGIGVFGVNSPVDVGTGRGGFALSMFLDVAEMIRIVDFHFTKKINFGLEVAPFAPIGRKSRLLLVAQAGFSF